MQKVVDFIEQNVHWLALGLGALWLLFMAYSFVITPPAQVELVPGESLRPGKVDGFVLEKSARPLDVAMNKSQKAPTIEVKDFAQVFRDSMGFANKEALALGSGKTWPSAQIKLDIIDGPGPDEALPEKGLADVPTMPVPVIKAVVSGRSTVQPPLGPNQQVQQVAQVDKQWVTQSAEISIDQMAKAFDKANIPPELAKTVFLKVELIRQEQLPDGAWPADGAPNSETIVPPFDPTKLRPPYPAPGAGGIAEMTYLTWATTNQGNICQPAFYQVVKGDPWLKPGDPNLVQEAVFDPATYDGPLEALTPQQYKDVMKARRENFKEKQQKQQQQQQPRQQPRQPKAPGGGDGGFLDPIRGGGGGGGGGGRSRGYPSPKDPERQLFAQVSRPERPPMPFDPVMDPFREGMPFIGDDFAQPPQPGAPTPGQPGVDFPAGEFEPSKWPSDTMIVWAHDDTVEPGKTYRYKIRYSIKNPLYRSNNAAKDPADAAKFDIVGEAVQNGAAQKWGEPVQVPDIVNFFIASGKAPGSNKMKFEFFRYDGGELQNKVLELGPGDAAGRVEGEIDYSTRWMLVDIRTDPRIEQDMVILMNAEGAMQTRTLRGDQSNPIYKRLKKEVEVAKQLAAGVNDIGG